MPFGRAIPVVLLSYIISIQQQNCEILRIVGQWDPWLREKNVIRNRPTDGPYFNKGNEMWGI